MGKIQSFRDLRVWQEGMTLVEQVYQVTVDFPQDERFGLVSQMRRAAVSIPSNIAEGHSRAHRKEYLHHLSIAQGSLAELETQLEIASRLNFLSTESFAALQSTINGLARQLHALRNALLRRPLSPDP